MHDANQKTNNAAISGLSPAALNINNGEHLFDPSSRSDFVLLLLLLLFLFGFLQLFRGQFGGLLPLLGFCLCALPKII